MMISVYMYMNLSGDIIHIDALLVSEAVGFETAMARDEIAICAD